jgi:glycosyltransferase involved in cell wall biosynthesis
LDVSLGVVELSEKLSIISGGLDWDFMDVLKLSLLKQKNSFKYYSIVYDLIALRYPQFVTEHYQPLLAAYIGELSWLADGFLCISERTERDVCDYFLAQGRPLPRSTVFPLGCDFSKRGISSDLNLPKVLAGKSFVLYVSTIEPRKSHRMLYEAWDYSMRCGLLNPDQHRMVFVGMVGWNVTDLLSEIKRNPATRDSILILNNVPDGMLDALYQHCAFTVYPSQIEGYGLPVAEALSKGKFCIVSDGVSLPTDYLELVEQVGAKDVMAWGSALTRYLTCARAVSEREQIVHANFKPVSWDAAADIFFSKLRSLSN